MKTETAAVQFDKAALLDSKRYAARQDALGVILEDGKQYTLAEVDAALEKFMKGAG